MGIERRRCPSGARGNWRIGRCLRGSRSLVSEWCRLVYCQLDSCGRTPENSSIALMTSGVGGFDSPALPPDSFRYEIAWFRPIRKPPAITSRGFFLPFCPHLSPNGTKFVPTLTAQDVGNGVGQFVLPVGYGMRTKSHGDANLWMTNSMTHGLWVNALFQKQGYR